MKLAVLAILPLFLSMPATVAAQRPRAAAPAQASTATTITVTDSTGAPIGDVRVVLTGPLDRSGSTQTNGTIRFDGLRTGTYRARFEKEGYVPFEREVEIRAGQPAPSPAVTLTSVPVAAPPPPPAAASKSAALPPPGKPLTIAVPDYIERNFITNKEPQKVSTVGCSGLANTLLWQIRESWDNRQHADADAMLYVIGGEGAVRLDGRDTPVEAGSFAQVPRGTSYGLIRRGRNPLIILATLAGEPCQ